MGRKNVIKNGYKMLDEADLTLTTTSNLTEVSNLDKASIHIVWSGTSPIGTIIVESTNDSASNPQAVWREVNFGSAIEITGNSGDHDIVFNELPFNAIRIKYVPTSGSGTINAALSASVVGA